MLVIKSLLSFCVRVGYLTINVGTFLKAPKTKDTLAQRILDKDEVKHLIGAARNDRDRCLLSLMYGCGLRVSEVCGLTWDGLRDGRATVFGKGSKTRTVLIPPSIWDRLLELPKIKNYVFLSRNNRPLERSWVHKLIKAAAKRAGLSDRVSRNDLRHSHASHALSAGCNFRLVQKSLGHSSISTTEKYLHISPDESSSQFIDI